MNASFKAADGKRTSGRARRQPMSERELAAYLLSRETLRRIRRTAAWLTESGSARDGASLNHHVSGTEASCHGQSWVGQRHGQRRAN
jgi:hypothetical protein